MIAVSTGARVARVGSVHVVAALLFAVSSAVTIAWCGSMAAMDGMPMPGGWTMSMAWMRMPGQTWAGATVTFLGMWVVMMVAMMLPSLVPMLSRYRAAVADRGARTVLVGLGYFAVWTAIGVAVFPLGVAWAAATMADPTLARAVPAATGVVVVLAGGVQLSAWKARRLACCRAGGVPAAPGAAGAWRHGLHLGLECARCCAGLTALLLVLGVMDLRVMAVVTTAITAERLAPGGVHVARGVGALLAAAGMWMLVAAVT